MKNNYLLTTWFKVSDNQEGFYSLKPCNSLEEAKAILKKYVRWNQEQYIVSMIYKDKNGKLHELK